MHVCLTSILFSLSYGTRGEHSIVTEGTKSQSHSLRDKCTSFLCVSHYCSTEAPCSYRHIQLARGLSRGEDRR